MTIITIQSDDLDDQTFLQKLNKLRLLSYNVANALLRRSNEDAF